MSNSSPKSRDALNMLKHFPLFLPSEDFKHWEGIVNIKGSEITLTIDVPRYPLMKDSKVRVHAGQLMEVITNIHLNADNMTLTEFLKRIQQINVIPPYYQKFVSSDGTANNALKDYVSFIDRCSKILKELKMIGEDNILKTDQELLHLSLRNVDDSGHEHIIDLRIPNNYPSGKPYLEHSDLPDVVIPQITSCNSINEVYSSFCTIISDLQQFWSVYDCLRNSAWVIDPEHPTKGDTYCRIVVSNNVSILVTLNPLEVMTFPDIKFLGPDRIITPLRKTLEDNLKEFGWDMNINLIDNLLTLLGLDEFPQPPDERSSQNKRTADNNDKILVSDQECSICFMLRSNDKMLPTKICNNDNCTSLYHISCLAQWFQCVPTNEPSFNLISGDCPHCGKRIFCPMNAP